MLPDENSSDLSSMELLAALACGKSKISSPLSQREYQYVLLSKISPGRPGKWTGSRDYTYQENAKNGPTTLGMCEVAKLSKAHDA